MGDPQQPDDLRLVAGQIANHGMRRCHARLQYQVVAFDDDLDARCSRSDVGLGCAYMRALQAVWVDPDSGW